MRAQGQDKTSFRQLYDKCISMAQLAPYIGRLHTRLIDDWMVITIHQTTGQLCTIRGQAGAWPLQKKALQQSFNIKATITRDCVRHSLLGSWSVWLVSRLVGSGWLIGGSGWLVGAYCWPPAGWSARSRGADLHIHKNTITIIIIFITSTTCAIIIYTKLMNN